MENEIENKSGLTQRIVSLIIERKKILISIFISIVLLFLGVKIFDYFKEIQNKEISEKYIKAGIYLSSNKKEQSLKIYREIINSKNKFYSILALNTIVEKSLINDDTKILKYFEILESLDFQEEKQDLIIFKKALFYLKISKNNEGRNLLKKLIEKNSKFKSLAEEIKTN